MLICVCDCDGGELEIGRIQHRCLLSSALVTKIGGLLIGDVGGMKYPTKAREKSNCASEYAIIRKQSKAREENWWVARVRGNGLAC